MILQIIFAIVAAAAVLLAFGWPRIHVPWRPGAEGIEDAKAAQAYDRISRWPQFRLLRRMIVGELRKYEPIGIIADIGCGPGHLAILIAQALPHLHVLGLDTAGEMVRTAESNASSQGLSNRAEFRTGDVSSLPLPDAALDFAISTLSLHHWSDPIRGLGEIHRVLRPGGKILLFDLRRDARRFFYCLLRFAQAIVVPAALRRANEPVGSALSSYTPDEIEVLFDRSPFREWKIKTAVGWMFIWARKG